MPSYIRKKPFYFNSAIWVKASYLDFYFSDKEFHSSAIFLVVSTILPPRHAPVFLEFHSLAKNIYEDSAFFGKTVLASNSKILPFLAIKVLLTPSELKKYPRSLNYFISFSYLILSISVIFWYFTFCLSVTLFHASEFILAISINFRSGFASLLEVQLSFIKYI